MKKLILTTAALVLATSLFTPASVYAQETPSATESITLSPVSRKYKIDAGQTVSDKLTVVNDGQVDYDFIVYSRPYSIPPTSTGDFDYTKPNFTAAPGNGAPKNADAYGWIQFPKTKYNVKAGATVEIAYTMSVPKQAAPGGHYGVIFAETQPSQSQGDGNAVVRKKRVGTILYSTVNGQFTTTGQLEKTNIPFWQTQPPLHAESIVKNTGNSDFTNDTIYTVKDVFGNIKFKETKQYTILPQTTRKMAFDWTRSSWFGLYKAELEQTVLGKKTTDSGYVLMMPRYLPILLLVGMIIGGAYVWFRRKKK